MQVTGFGVVPFEFDSSDAILKWKIPRKLRVKSTTVILSFEDPLGSNKSFPGALMLEGILFTRIRGKSQEGERGNR